MTTRKPQHLFSRIFCWFRLHETELVHTRIEWKWNKKRMWFQKVKPRSITYRMCARCGVTQ